MSIGRNDPCLCGSGKKYKKCCGKREGAAITAVLVEESSTIQRELIDYAMERHSAMLKKEFQPLLKSNETLRQNEQVFLVTFEIWAILTRTIKENETILTEFVKKRVPSISRQRTAEIVASWVDYHFMAGVIESCDGPVYEVRDILTNEMYSVRALRSVDLVGAFVIGALLPHESDYTFFMTDFHFEAEHAQAMARAVQEMFGDSPFEDPQAFFTHDFAAVMDTLFAVYEKGHAAVDLTSLVWTKDAHRETAEHIEASFEQEQLGQPITQMAVLLWNYYCTKEDPAVRKPEVFTASLIGLLQAHGLIERKESKAAIAGRYAISAATLSKRQKEMEAVLEEKLQAADGAQK
ncbi:SEC-C metal-binding domain-containing protein [Domibacillus indicus]|uniref:SEC-C metal-binding domain-containing protein n=1 Tax=Domibacillus indicus TaxID=1437523 RepID=UPI000617C5B9|nr:SEC-C metal-binding domain-containing protein [Domibacillus indicus]